MGAARISKLHGLDEARFSVLISDCCHGQGLGTLLVKHTIDLARSEKLNRITAQLTADNTPMQHIFQKLGFELHPTQDGMVEAEMKF
jgi:acetyltransferase